jgi:6-phosphogluconolactonase
MLLEDYGGHAEGIYTYSFDPSNGSLAYLKTTQTRNPSYLCLHPNRKLLFSVEEEFKTNHPAINAFKTGERGSLEFMNRQPMPGGLPCHLAVVHDSIATVACYETGQVVSFPIKEDGSLGSVSDLIQHDGKSLHTDRQQGAHAHMIVPFVFGQKVGVCDLGMDKICLYHFAEDRKKLVPANQPFIEIPPGNGPRHMHLHPNNKYAFVMCELTSNVIVLKNQSCRWKVYSICPTLPGDYTGEPSGAAIRVNPSGKFIYASNRGHNSVSILRFDAERGSLELMGNQRTGGETPREIQLDPEGKWLLAAHQDSDSIVVFKIDQKNGNLKKSSEYHVKSPVCLVWGE